MGYSLFAFIVCVFQAAITYLDLKIAKRFSAIRDYESASVNILCAISWGLTACWWLYQAISGIFI